MFLFSFTGNLLRKNSSTSSKLDSKITTVAIAKNVEKKAKNMIRLIIGSCYRRVQNRKWNFPGRGGGKKNIKTICFDAGLGIDRSLEGNLITIWAPIAYRIHFIWCIDTFFFYIFVHIQVPALMLPRTCIFTSGACIIGSRTCISPSGNFITSYGLWIFT